jgi:hypothetical protein
MPVTLHCVVHYTGRWPPVLQWTRLSDNSTMPSRAIYYNHPTSNFTRAKDPVLALNASASDNGKYLCTTFFRLDDKPVGTNAVNVPEYFDNCVITASMLLSPTTAAGDTDIETTVAVLIACEWITTFQF